MAGNDSSSKPPPLRARRWSATPLSSTPYQPYRLIFRILGIPILAVAAVFIYRGLRERLVLPECDSARAQQTLAEVLKEMKLEPVRYEPIKTVASDKKRVVCNAALPLPDGANVVVEYSFYWQGDKVNMKYSVTRRPVGSSPAGPGDANVPTSQ